MDLEPTYSGDFGQKIFVGIREMACVGSERHKSTFSRSNKANNQKYGFFLLCMLLIHGFWVICASNCFFGRNDIPST